MIKKVCGVLIALVTAAVLSVGVSAEIEDIPDFTAKEQEYISSHSTLKVGFVPDRIPVSFSKNGEFAGISRYILDRVSEISGIKFEYSALPTKDVTYDYLSGNRFDLVTSVEYNEENKHARGILISTPYLSSRKVVVAREKFEFRFDGDFTVAVSTGSQTLKKVLERAFPNFKIRDYDTISDCLDAVNNGQADLMIQNQYVVEYWLSKPIYEGLKVIPINGLDDELCFSAVVPIGDNSDILRKDGETLIGILDKSIACLSEDEVLNYIIQGVMENQYSYDIGDFFSRYKYSVFLFSIFFVMIVVLGLILVRLRIRIAESRANAKAKSEFLSTMNHELCTPLNGMIGLNRLMSQNIDAPKKLEEYLKQSTVTAKYLLALVNDLLDSSMLQTDTFKTDCIPVDLVLLTETVITTARNAMTERGIEFMPSVEIIEPYIFGDSVRIQQVLFNLLDNARKFTLSGGSVRFTLKQEKSGDDVLNIFTVADNGRGMSEEFVANAFDTFSQELETVSNGNQGTGLGLSISHRLAHLMNGDITCESKRGMGSTFTFSFTAAVSGAPEPVEHTGHKIKPRILIAEDNELNAEILTELLRSEGIESDVAENGKKALEMFKDSGVGSYGVILMDLLMPELDGFETAKAIRALERPDAKTVRIIACTANSYNNEYEKSIKAGMNDFVTKPVDIDVLFEKIYQ